MTGDRNLEWLGYVQPVGLVLSSAILDHLGLEPEEQTRADGVAVAACLSPDGEAQALADPWPFFSQVLNWREHQLAGGPGGRTLPDGLSVTIEETDEALEPHWAVIDPEGQPTLLVRIEAPGVGPDRRGALAGWEATPHQRFERLLRENAAGVRAGILLTDGELRLVYAPKGETSGWLSFPLRALATVAGRPMLGGLKLALNAFRLHNEPPDRRLPGLLKQSRGAQAEVSAKLAGQVLGSLHRLLRGFHAADEARIEKLAADRSDHLYGGLLTVLLRLVFLLYAEDRGLIPSATDEDSRRLYDQGYGARALHAKLTEDAARYPDTMEERRGAWARLLVLFRLVHRGGGSGFVLGRGGDLFDPAIYPFLMGQDAPGDSVAPAVVSDACILDVLKSLLILGGERLSYRTLDVEQIGSVYETVMGFTVETTTGSALALRGGKNDKVPVFVDLAELVALKGADRLKWLKDEYDVKLPDKVAKACAAATMLAEVEEALKPRVDERASPGATPSPPGSPLLQPSDERRRTGSHYTPRELTEPLVRHALDPAFKRLGPHAKPDEVLDLKVCDPAMGSGAFLVEACRQLAARLVKAWARWPETRPRIPDDEDEELHARRLVAQRCLYGVDKNARAVELAKLSLWLATLAREHEFTFLDHALKCGDSLVGLDADQIAAMHWDASKPGLPLFRRFVAERVAEATKARAEIQSAPDDTMRALLEQKHRFVEDRVADVRVLGDAVISAFFAEHKPKVREKRRATIESWVAGVGSAKWDELHAAAEGLQPLRPFHWEIEFPEVFARQNPGFDAIVGNPPFLNGTRISTRHGEKYRDWLLESYHGTTGKADLVAFFFRRAFNLIRRDGAFGLVATITIAMGDTRPAALERIVADGGKIYNVVKRIPWLGLAAVTVSTVHVSKGSFTPAIVLNGYKVDRISAFLLRLGPDTSPSALRNNRGKCFSGPYVMGAGFLFDDKDSGASPISEMRRLLSLRPEYIQVIWPYLGGEEFLTDPRQSHRRCVIYLGESDEQAARASWPELMEILERKVRPERSKKDASKYPRMVNEWWKFWNPRHELMANLARMDRVLMTPFTASHLCFGFVPARTIVGTPHVVICSQAASTLSALHNRCHELWVRFLGSTMEDRQRYTPTDCFETFPFPECVETLPALEAAGQAYHDHRFALMVARDEGMTKIYNRFHNPDERSEDIVRLRELHAEMDRAVLRAYGWDDLADRAEPIFLDETNEDEHTYKGRLFWPSAFRDEVLARLLALNAERAAAERAAGLSPAAGDADDGSEDDEDAA